MVCLQCPDYVVLLAQLVLVLRVHQFLANGFGVVVRISAEGG